MGFQNTLTIAKVALYALEVKGGVSPQMALGAMPKRPALLLRIEDSDGCYGWGEIWANFPPRAHLHKAHLVEDVIAPKLLGASYVEPREIEHQLRESLTLYFLHVGQSIVFEHILAGVDTALWDLSLRKANETFASFVQLSESTAPVYASSINTDDLDRLIPHHAALGQTHFKLKIGFLKGDDHALVERAVALIPENAHLMVDSNQMWNLERAKKSLRSLEVYQPLFAEECLPADACLSDWDALAKSTTIPLAGGENIYGLENFVAMANAGLRVLQPDVAKWGGVTGALDLADALPSGTLLWPHFMGSAVGQMAALSVTASVGGGSVCEVDVNENALRTELCGDAMSIVNGRMTLVDGNGLVCEPRSEVLARCSV
ncbi:MAG: mandelate racemase/muconate lactonizing enzyme family protein [Granulosicoccus sp.]|nr:mandelate racemase/muconate lactonizing enzyme family protein [Granulosicoccus sp.]